LGKDKAVYPHIKNTYLSAVYKTLKPIGKAVGFAFSSKWIIFAATLAKKCLLI
jgi:hypothetical protein